MYSRKQTKNINYQINAKNDEKSKLLKSCSLRRINLQILSIFFIFCVVTTSVQGSKFLVNNGDSPDTNIIGNNSELAEVPNKNPLYPDPTITPAAVISTQTLTPTAISGCNSTQENEQLPPESVEFQSDSESLITIQYGETVQGEMSGTGEIDNYTFVGNTGDHIFLYEHSAFSEQIQLFSPEGEIIGEINRNDEIQAIDPILEIDGSYRISVKKTASSSSSKYGMSFMLLNNISGTPISYGSAQQQRFDLIGETDTFTFFGNEGDSIFTIAGYNPYYSPALFLYSPSGNLIASTTGSDDDCGINANLPETGDYTIITGDPLGYPFDYGIFLQKAVEPENAYSLAYGETKEDSISIPFDMDTYAFSAQKGDRVFIRGSGDFSPRLNLFAPNGTPLLSETEELIVTLEDAGEYIVVLGGDYGYQTGYFGINIQCINDPVGCKEIIWEQSINGQINKKAEMNCYSFNATAGESMLIHIVPTYPLKCYSHIFAPDGTLVESFEIHKLFELAPEQSGAYLILIGDLDGVNTGAYTIYMQSISHPDTIRQISYGETYTGSFSSTAEMRTFSFTANPGDNIYTRVSLSSSWSPVLSIYSAEGELIATSYYDGEIIQKISERGEYRIIIGDNSGQETMQFGLFLQNTILPVNATQLTCGYVHEDQIDLPGEMDTFEFSAQSGDHIYLITSSLAFDPQIRLLDQEGTLIANQLDGYHNDLDLALEKPGNYSLIIGDRVGKETGDYAVSLQMTNAPENAQSITFGETIEGNITRLSEYDSYVFSGSVGEHIAVSLDSEGSGRIQLYSPNGTPIDPNNYGLIDHLLDSEEEFLVLAGTYSGEQTGEYGITLQSISNPVNATSIAYGETMNATATTFGEMETYLFDGEAGDHVLILYKSPPYTYTYPVVGLYSPTGECIVKEIAHGEVIAELPEDGEYVLVLCAGKGDYSLFLQRVKTPQNGIPLTMGETVENTITTPGETDSYTFVGGEGDYLYARTCSEPNGMCIRIISPEGELVDYKSSEINCQLPSAGEYTLIAGYDNNVDTGSYGIYMQKTSNPLQSKEIAFGSCVMGNITRCAQMDTYTFHSGAGEHIFIRTAMAEKLLLFDPDGSFVIKTNHGLRYETTIEGTYTLLVGDSSGDNTGPYPLYLQNTKNPVNATNIDFGEVYRGNITDNITRCAWMDAYTFHSGVGDHILIRTDHWGEVWLFNPDGSFAKCNTVELRHEISIEGNYTLFAGDHNFDTSGLYSIYFQNTKNPVNATNIQFGGFYLGNISENAYMKSYQFAANSGDRIIKKISSLSLDEDIQLYAPDGSLVYEYGEVTHLADAGMYTILVGDTYCEHTGDFHFYLQRANNPGNYKSIEYAATCEGSISQPAEHDTFTFDVAENDCVCIKLKRGTNDSLDGMIRVYNPQGECVDTGYSGSSLVEKCSENGSYTLLVGGHHPDDTGTYGLFLQKTNAPIDAKNIGFGDYVHELITEGADVHTYQFAAKRGDSIFTRMSMDDYASLELFAPNGTRLGYDSTQYGKYCTELFSPVKETGNYTLICGITGTECSGDPDMGVYLQNTANPVNATSLRYGDSIDDAIIAPGSMNTYDFYAQLGDTVQISTSMGRESYVLLLSPDGTLLEMGGYYGSIDTQIPQTGKYCLLVGFQDESVGNYTFSLQGIHPIPIEIGKTYSDTLCPDSSNHYYLSIFQGEELVIQVHPEDSSGKIELYGALNRFPTKDDYDYVQRIVSPEGTYDLLISPTNSGMYCFAVYSNDPENLNYSIKTSAGETYISNIYPQKLLNSQTSHLQVYGIGLTKGMDVELRNETSTIDADTVVLGSTTTLIATYELSDVSYGYFDVAVVWPDGTERILYDAVEISEVPVGVLGMPEELSLNESSTKSFWFDVPETEDLYFTLQKSSLAQYSVRGWNGMISVEKDGEIIAQKSGCSDYMIHLVYPEPGIYHVNITAYNAGEGIFAMRNALPGLPLGEYIIDCIHTSAGCIWYQLDVPPDQEILSFRGEAIGDQRISVYYEKYESANRYISTWAHDLDIPSPKPGVYIVEVKDYGILYDGAELLSDQSREVMIYASTTPQEQPVFNYIPVISGISPKMGGNSGAVTITCEGSWLDANASVSLTAPDQESIIADDVDGDSDKNVLHATFDLTDAEPGPRNLTIINPDGQSDISQEPFIITECGTGEFWVDIICGEHIRIGRPRTGYIDYGNNGTLNMPAPLINLVAVEPSSDIEVKIGDSDWRQMDEPVTILAAGYPEQPDVLPAGSRFSIPIQVKAQSTEPFTLHAVPFTQDRVLASSIPSTAIDAACPAPGMPLVFARSFPNEYTCYLGPFGYGWMHSFDMRLEKMMDGEYGLRQGDNVLSTFLDSGTDVYTEISGSDDFVLKKNPDGTFILEDRIGNRIGFRSDLLPDFNEDVHGNRISMTYDASRHLVEISHSSGDSFTIGYNAEGRISSIVDHTGDETVFSYDDSGTLLESVTGEDGLTTVYDYTEQNGCYVLLSITAPDGNTVSMGYEGSGPTSLTLNDDTCLSLTSYDQSTGSTSMMDPDGNTRSVTTNTFGQPLLVSQPGGGAVEYEYDSSQNLVGLNGPSGEEYALAYDDDENPVLITDPLGYETEFGWDEDTGNIAWVEDGRDNRISYRYDDMGNVDQITHPDSSTETITYDAVGSPATVTTRKGDVIQYTYNERGQITRADYSGGMWGFYTYDDAGNMISAEDGHGLIAMVYDDRNQLTRITYPDGKFLNYTYDTFGKLIERTDHDNATVIYGYDTIGRLTQIYDGEGQLVVQYGYDTRGGISRKTLGNGDYSTYAYNTDGRISELVNYNMTGAVLSQFACTYDLSGNPVTIETLDGIQQYEYDATGQLTGATYPDGYTVSYSYDAAGNRVSVVENGVTTSYATNDLNQYTSAGSTSYAYDLNGNLISETTDGNITTYVYNADDRLVKVTSPDGVWEYEYDALGNRNAVITDGTRTEYFIDPSGLGNVVAEYDETGQLTTRYTHGYGLISQADQTGAEYYYHFNPTGHTTEITNIKGDVVNQYQYAPFGKLISKYETISNHFRYVGEYGIIQDKNGLFYMRARNYNPLLARFIESDPLLAIDGLNFYTYVGNSPINHIDPSGMRTTFFVDADLKLALPFGGSQCSEQEITWDTNYHQLDGKYRSFGTSYGGYFGAGIGVGLAWSKNPNAGWEGKFKNISIGLGISIEIFWNEDWFGIQLGLGPGGGLQFGEQTYWRTDKKPYCPDRSGGGSGPASGSGEQQSHKPVGSVDPEDKFGPSGYDPVDTASEDLQRFVSSDQTFEYQVIFWNAENATAPVCDVDAYDQLDTDLDWTTFRFTEIGFTKWRVPLEPCQYFDVNIDARPDIDLIVNIEGIYDPVTGRADLTYHALDPETFQTPDDPMAGFLPAIGEDGEEVGWFSYRVSPDADLQTGDVIDNRAWVNFDYSKFMPAPKDAPWINTIDSASPSSSLSATLMNETEMHLTISGADDAGGSGIDHYIVYQSMDGGDYQPACSGLTHSKLVVNGIHGHDYRFYSVAVDNVGNAEAPPAAPDATISIEQILPPTAEFSADTLEGCAPCAIRFTDSSAGDIDSWLWCFGDGEYSGEQNPSHTYTEPGTYPVSLTVSGPTGSDRMNKARYITVAEGPSLPVANFLATPCIGAPPLHVEFMDLSTGEVDSWFWTFGDGTNATTQHPVHTFTEEGRYTVTLSVNDSVNTCIKSPCIRVTSLLLGDANDDGEVNQVDTLRVLKEVVGIVTRPEEDSDELIRTDVHLNDAIDVGDAMFIAQYNVGLRDHRFALVQI